MSVVPIIIGAVHSDSQFGGIGGKVLVYGGLAVLWGLVGLVPLLSKEPTSKKYKAPQPAQPWTVVAVETECADLAQLIANEGRTIDGAVKEVCEPHRIATADARWGR